MIQRAEWRRRLAGPQTPLGLIYGTDRWRGLPVGLWIVAYFATATFGAGFFSGDLRTLVFLGAMLSISPFRGQRGLASGSSLVGNPTRLSELAPSPTPDAVFVVSVELKQGEKTTGWDQGVVAFSDGWMVFEGREVAFSLSPADVTRGDLDGKTWRLLLPRSQSLGFEAFDPDFVSAGRQWLGQSPPRGLSRLPPLEASLSRRLLTAGRLQWFAALLAGGVLGAAIRTVFSGVPFRANVPVLAATVGVLLVFAWLSVRRNR